MLVYYFLPFIVNNRCLLFQISSGHNSVTVQNRTHVRMNFFAQNHSYYHFPNQCRFLLNHPVYIYISKMCSKINPTVIKMCKRIPSPHSPLAFQNTQSNGKEGSICCKIKNFLAYWQASPEPVSSLLCQWQTDGPIFLKSLSESKWLVQRGYTQDVPVLQSVVARGLQQCGQQPV